MASKQKIKNDAKNIKNSIKNRPLILILGLTLIISIATLLFILFSFSPSLIFAFFALGAIFYVLNEIFKIPFGNDVLIMMLIAAAAAVGFYYLGPIALLLVLVLFVFILFDVEEYLDDKYVHKDEHPVSSAKQPPLERKKMFLQNQKNQK